MTQTTNEVQKVKGKELKAASKSSTLPSTQNSEKMKLEPCRELLPVIKPKGPKTNFIMFSSEKLKNPSEIDGEQHKDKIKAIAELWKALNDEEKLKYTKLSEEDKVRFQRETAQLKDDGFFVNADGVKSTDIKPELKLFPKETVMPKKSLTAYMCFLKEFDNEKLK
jgi:hypothetical protein